MIKYECEIFILLRPMEGPALITIIFDTGLLVPDVSADMLNDKLVDVAVLRRAKQLVASRPAKGFEVGHGSGIRRVNLQRFADRNSLQRLLCF
jgi:hypothetical protein